MDTVGRSEALAFCVKLTQTERQARRLGNDWEYTLPMEAQWEYACRAETKTPFMCGYSLTMLDANFRGENDSNSDALRRTTAAGKYRANGWGLHDMHGNVWECVRDWKRDQLPGGLDPEVTRGDSDAQEILRGGSWTDLPGALRSAHRQPVQSRFSFRNTGFRVALVSRSPAATPGAWIKLLDTKMEPTDPTRIKLTDGVLELDDTTVVFPEIRAKDVILRGKIKKLDREKHVTLTVRHSDQGRYHGYHSYNPFGQWVGISKWQEEWEDLKFVDVKVGSDFTLMSMEARGDQLRVSVDDKPIVSFIDGSFSEGAVSISAHLGRAQFKDLEVMVLDQVPVAAKSGILAAPESLQHSQWVSAVGFSAEKAKEHQRSWAEFLGVPVTFENSIGMKFSLIPPGEFEMGGGGQFDDEIPTNGNRRHHVSVTRPYYLAIHETRQRDFKTVSGTNPAKFDPANRGSFDHPVESLLVRDIEAFCRQLAALTSEKTAGRTYRLPTEAEWEHACRAGTVTRFTFGETITRAQANFKGNGSGDPAPKGMTVPVGSYLPNAWGLFDMHGNVGEWTKDFKDSGFNSRSTVDPTGPFSGDMKVFKGGDFGSTDDIHVSSGMRFYGGLGAVASHIGFRVVLQIPTDAAARKAQGSSGNPGRSLKPTWKEPIGPQNQLFCVSLGTGP